MVLGGVAQMLAPKARTPRTQTTDNGKQNTYFSSLDKTAARASAPGGLYGEMRVGSRVLSQEISTADEGDGGPGCGGSGRRLKTFYAKPLPGGFVVYGA